VVSLHIDVFIDDLLASSTLEVARSVGCESPGREVRFRWVVGIPTDEVERSQDAGRHVVDSPLGNGAVENGDGQIGT